MNADGASSAVTGLVGLLGAFQCQHCGVIFQARQRKQLYCSPHCSDAGYNFRRPVTRQARLDFTPAASEHAHALRGRESKAQRILARLRQGPASTLDLARVGGIRFGARILELRRAGHVITREDFRTGQDEWSVYTWVGEK